MGEIRNSIFPALRGQMGDWTYYVALMTLRDIAAWVKRAGEIHEREELRTWIQRDITEMRLSSIANYLTSQPQRFFNAIVLGIYGGQPDWFPVNIKEKPDVTFELNE